MNDSGKGKRPVFVSTATRLVLFFDCRGSRVFFVRVICKILKNSTIFPKIIHSSARARIHIRFHASGFFSFQKNFTHSFTILQAISRIYRRIFSCSKFNEFRGSESSLIFFFFLRFLISKPYNFYTWHTPNMAGRQSLHLIKYSNRFFFVLSRVLTRSHLVEQHFFFLFSLSFRRDSVVVVFYKNRRTVVREFCTSLSFS